MPVATATLTGDLGALPVGQEFQPSALRAWIETNLPKSAVLVDTTTGGQVHLGPWVLTLDSDGKFSQSGLPRSGTGDTNPSTFQYRVVVEYEDPVTRRAQRWTSTYFTLDSATASLNTILGEQYAPPEWKPVNYDQLEQAVEDALGDRQGPPGPQGPQGDQGPQGERGLPGVNAVPADEAVAAYIDANDSATRGALADAFDRVRGEDLIAKLAALPAWEPGDPMRRIVCIPGDYTISEAIRVPSGVYLSLYGCKFTLADGANTDVITNADHATGNSNIIIEGGHLDGNSPNQTIVTGGTYGQSGISIVNATFVTIRDVFAEWCLYHSFDVTGTSYNAFVEGEDTGHVLIENCRARKFGDDGFTTHFCHDVTFRNCYSYEARRPSDPGGTGPVASSHGFEVDDGSTDIKIEGCVAWDNEGSGFQVQCHSGRPFHNRVQLTSCHSYENTSCGFIFVNNDEDDVKLEGIVATNLSSRDNGLDGLRLERVQNVAVSGFISHRDFSGVRVIGNPDPDTGEQLARNLTVDNFLIVDPRSLGVYLHEASFSEGARFTNGVIVRPNNVGMHIGQDDVTVRNVRVVRPGSWGWRVLSEVNRLTIEGCELAEAPSAGVVIQGAAHDITIRGCKFDPPTTTGKNAVEFATASTASDVLIESNRMTGWNRGVFYYQSTLTDVIVRGNDFTDSVSNGISNSGSTISGTYTVEGNLGFKTEAFGSATIPDGSSAVTVTHGIGSPTVGYSPTTVLPGPRKNEAVWVSARNTSTFTLTRAGTAGDLIVDWRAIYQPA